MKEKLKVYGQEVKLLKFINKLKVNFKKIFMDLMMLKMIVGKIIVKNKDFQLNMDQKV